MSSNFSSNKAYYDSAESRATSVQSRSESVSETPTLGSKHSKTSKSSSKSSSKILSTTSSNRSAFSFSKPPSRTSSKHSSSSSHRHRSKYTLADIRAHSESYGESSQSTPAPMRNYATSPVRSNPRYISSTTIMTEAEYRARMQELIDGIGPRMDLTGTTMDSYDAQVNPYDAQLDLDEDDYEHDYDMKAHD